ncbi:MAG: hypothetical protein KIT81_11640 [Alphaproteobacteria bacterium]|nr:hypothetical protein [Alphaproteobacteria bacterium]
MTNRPPDRRLSPRSAPIIALSLLAALSSGAGPAAAQIKFDLPAGGKVTVPLPGSGSVTVPGASSVPSRVISPELRSRLHDVSVYASSVARSFSFYGKPRRGDGPDFTLVWDSEKWVGDTARCMDAARDAHLAGGSSREPITFNTHGVLRDGVPLASPMPLHEVGRFCAEIRPIAEAHLASLRSQQRR